MCVWRRCRQARIPTHSSGKTAARRSVRLLEAAESFVDFRARQLHAGGLFATPEGKTQAIRSLVETIARYPDELKRTFYLKRIAQEYEVYESVLFREMEKITGRHATQHRFGKKQDTPQESRTQHAPVGGSQG